MENDPVVHKFDELLRELQAKKTEKRTDQDRFIAIAMTDVEKARAVYILYATNGGVVATPFVNWNK